MRPATGLSISAQLRGSPVISPEWWSHFVSGPWVACTNRTPDSENRRASRQRRPKSPVTGSSRPYSRRVASDSPSTLISSGASVCMRNASSYDSMRPSRARSGPVDWSWRRCQRCSRSTSARCTAGLTAWFSRKSMVASAVLIRVLPMAVPL